MVCFCLLSKYTSLAWTDSLIVGSLLLWIWFCRIDPMPSLFLSLCTYFLQRTVFLSSFLSAPHSYNERYYTNCPKYSYNFFTLIFIHTLPLNRIIIANALIKSRCAVFDDFIDTKKFISSICFYKCNSICII